MSSLTGWVMIWMLAAEMALCQDYSLTEHDPGYRPYVSSIAVDGVEQRLLQPSEEVVAPVLGGTLSIRLKRPTWPTSGVIEFEFAATPPLTVHSATVDSSWLSVELGNPPLWPLQISREPVPVVIGYRDNRSIFSALGSEIRLSLKVRRESDSEDASHVEISASLLRHSSDPVTPIQIERVDLLAYQSVPNRVEQEGFEVRLILGSCGLLRLSLEDYGASTLALHLKPSRPLWLEGIQIHQPNGLPFGPKGVLPHPATTPAASYPLRIAEPTKVFLGYSAKLETGGVLGPGHAVDLNLGLSCKVQEAPDSYFLARIRGRVPSTKEVPP